MSPKSVPDPLAEIHPQMLRAGSESDRKKLAAARRSEIGRLVERALELARISKQDAAWRMGYTDAGTVSRWCSGTERPQFDQLLVLEGFIAAWVLALAERHPQTLSAETIVTIRRTA